MPKIITVLGANTKDEQLRLKYLENINDLPTDVLEKLSFLSQQPKAIKAIKNIITWTALKAYLKI